MKFYTLLLLLILSLTIESQAISDSLNLDKILKLNINYNQFLRNDRIFEIGNIAPSIVIQNKKKNLHEIELSRFIISKNNEKYFSIFNTDFGLRYQYDQVINSSGKVRPFVGFSMLQAIKYKSSKPSILNSFQRKIFNYDIITSVVPGCLYNVSKKLVLNLEMPITLAEYNFTRNRVFNSNIPKTQQVLYENKIQSFRYPDLHLRFGIGYTL